MKGAILSLSIAVALMLAPTTAFADTTCTPVYGGGQTCTTTGQMTINKTIENPQTGQFVNNLGINDPKYGANNTVNYQITVTNNSGSTLNNITVTDAFPNLISFQSGPGSFNNGVLTFTIASLAPSQSQTFNVSSKVASNLPAGITCDGTLNTATASTAGQPTVQATSSTCLQASAAPAAPGVTVFPPPSATTTPKTGPEALALIGLLPTGALGAFLRKKTKLS